ncbi:MAG: hypothetical protein RR490_09275, partial [Niameybacter sp.]
MRIEDPVVQIKSNVPSYEGIIQCMDLDDAIAFNAVIETKGNKEAYNLYYCLETEHVSFEPALESQGRHIQVLQPKQFMTIGAIGKLDCFPRKGQVSIRGKLCYEFWKGEQKKQRTIYTDQQILYVYTAGPISEDAFCIKMSQQIISIGERVSITCFIANEGNRRMEHVKLSLKGLEACGFYIEHVYCDDQMLGVQNVPQKIDIGILQENKQEHITIEGYATCIPATPNCEFFEELEYAYTMPSSKSPKKVIKKTQPKTFILKESGLSEEKGIRLSANKDTFKLGESCMYTLSLCNNGNVTTENIKVKLHLSQQLEVQKNTLSMKGCACKGSLSEGIYIEKLGCGMYFEMSFMAKLKEIFPMTEVTVGGNVIYEYKDSKDNLRVCEKPINNVSIGV